MKPNMTMLWAGPLPPNAIEEETRREPMIWAGPLPPAHEQTRRHSPHSVAQHPASVRRQHART